MPIRRTSGKPRSRRRSLGPDKRAPFASTVPKPVKRVAGRTTAPLVPANIRTKDVQLTPEHRKYIRERLGMKLGKFAPSIERVSVRVRDVNGPKGGVDRECSIKVVLSAMPSVVVTRQSALLEAAVNEALDAAARSVRRNVRRRRPTTSKRKMKRAAEPTRQEG